MNTNASSLLGAIAARAALAAVAGLLTMAAPQQGAADDGIADGRQLVTERAKGNCLACHAVADGQLPGNIGPPLLAMRARFPEREVLREQIWDATDRNPDSRMPPFGRHGILTDQEIEQIIDYLYTL